MLIETRFYENVLHTKGKVHITKTHIFRNFELPHVCTVFSTICGTVVSKNEHGGSIEIRVFEPPWTILRLSGPEIFGTGMCD